MNENVFEHHKKGKRHIKALEMANKQVAEAPKADRQQWTQYS